MDTEGQDFLGIPSGKDAPPTGPPLDASAKTLADGTISRGQALKLMGAGTAAVASLALAGCGGNTTQAKGSSSGSGQPSGTSTIDTTVGKKVSTSKQGPDAEEMAAAKRAMEKYHLKAVLARVTKGT